ncbi:MAG: EamA family transporter [Paracoccaceae bacterium]
MSSFVFVAVIFAACLHAVWNALVKAGADKQLGMIAVVMGHVPLAVIALLLVPAPAPQSWPFIAVGVFLHVGYQLFLQASYRIGDLTQVYPIARGTAPLLVTAVSVAFLGVHLQPLEFAGIMTIGLGILSLMFVRQNNGERNLKAAGLALVTSCFIAAYSLVDGTGVRLAGSALGFFAWLCLGNAVVIAGVMMLTNPGILTNVMRRGKRTFLIGGTASFTAFSIVIWAFTQAPIALVTALRETSIIFALVIGVIFLRERLTASKLVSTAVMLVGAGLLRVSSS